MITFAGGSFRRGGYRFVARDPKPHRFFDELFERLEVARRGPYLELRITSSVQLNHHVLALIVDLE